MNALFQGSYDQFKLSPELALGIKDLGYAHPTFVQNEVFYPIQKSQDLVVQSHTGSGKTTAFCLPVLTKITPDQYPQALILAPTRELAKQVAAECSRLGHHAKIQVTAIYGGASFDAQIAALKAGAQIIVGTPGRVKDLFARRILDLSHIKIAVLDEADEMLSMGFWDDVTHLLEQTPKNHQTLLFSATLPAIIEQSLGKITRDPITIKLSSDHISAESVRHVIHLENEAHTKSRNLLYALEFHRPKRAIVFCNTKDETELLEKYLKRFSLQARALNGDMSQNAREKVMHEIKSGQLEILIATDIAARGIDIAGLTHVFNYELPDNPESYVHRTGRTGRMGQIGTAVSLIRGKDALLLDQLKKSFGVDYEEVRMPADSEILWMQGERLACLLTEHADGVEISQYRPIATSILTRPDLSEILAFLMRSHFSKVGQSAPEQARPPRKPVAPRPTPPPPAFKQIYVTLGRQDGFNDLTALANHVSELSKIDLGHFTGSGNLRDTSSHLEVDTEVAEKIKTAVHGLPRASGVTETLICDIAQPKPKRPFQKRRPTENVR
ncbi:MAG: DEAD/DEAH box helicase [Myxococcaceae bacterium]